MKMGGEQKIQSVSKSFLSTVFLVEDDEVFGKVQQRNLERNPNCNVKWFRSGEDFLNSLHENPDIVILDCNLPGMSGIELLEKIKRYNSAISVVVLSGQQDVEVVVNCYKLGTDAYIVKNDSVHVELERAMQGLIEKNNLRKEVEELRDLIVDRSKYYKILGDSPAILKVLRLIQKVEKNDILVMVTGESGTGKELVAKAIHYNSPRKRGSFVAVNMAAIPEDLVESELFGHEKGAYTGADSRRIGKFEEANGGTIFLDEIGECDHNTQLKLLRVLQEGKLMRLGSNKELELNVRVIAATNKNLSQKVKEGKFREDLYYRLQGFLIHLPPLKNRGHDAILLARHFLKEFCAENKLQVMGFSKSALDMIAQHPFPGNVRELKATVERAALLTDGDTITADDLVFSETI